MREVKRMKELKNCPFDREKTNEMNTRTIENQHITPDIVVNQDNSKPVHDYALELFNSTNSLL